MSYGPDDHHHMSYTSTGERLHWSKDKRKTLCGRAVKRLWEYGKDKWLSGPPFCKMCCDTLKKES